VSETSKTLLQNDLARREQARTEISHADIDERARNHIHADLLVELAVARWMQENPKPDANRDTLELLRGDVEYTKHLLADFEANGYRYPNRHDQP
jgi:hypothetical protein